MAGTKIFYIFTLEKLFNFQLFISFDWKLPQMCLTTQIEVTNHNNNNNYYLTHRWVIAINNILKYLNIFHVLVLTK